MLITPITARTVPLGLASRHNAASYKAGDAPATKLRKIHGNNENAPVSSAPGKEMGISMNLMLCSGSGWNVITHRVHSALNMTPLDNYLSQMSQVKMVERSSLKVLFETGTRKVRHDGTNLCITSLKCRLFIGQKIELRYDEELKQVYVLLKVRK